MGEVIGRHMTVLSSDRGACARCRLMAQSGHSDRDLRCPIADIAAKTTHSAIEKSQQRAEPVAYQFSRVTKFAIAWMKGAASSTTGSIATQEAIHATIQCPRNWTTPVGG